MTATKISSLVMKMEMNNGIVEVPYPRTIFCSPKMKIMHKKLKMMTCPAVMFANNRTVSENGLVNIPKISTIGMIGIGNFNHQGNPGIFTMCFHYCLLPLTLVITKLCNAKQSITACHLNTSDTTDEQDNVASCSEQITKQTKQLNRVTFGPWT